MWSPHHPSCHLPARISLMLAPVIYSWQLESDLVFVVSPQAGRNWDTHFWSLSMKHKDLHFIQTPSMYHWLRDNMIPRFAQPLRVCSFHSLTPFTWIIRSDYCRSDDRNHFTGDPQSIWKVLEMEKFRDQPLQAFTYQTGTRGPEWPNVTQDWSPSAGRKIQSCRQTGNKKQSLNRLART